MALDDASPQAAPAPWLRRAAVAIAALALLQLLWELRLAPLRPEGSWLALKAVPLALLWPALARGSSKAAQGMLLLLLPYFAEGVVRGMTETGRHAIVAWTAATLSVVAFTALLLHFRAARHRQRPSRA
jgi:uncharacterized membrane protein